MSSHTSGHILSHPFEAMSAMVSLIWYGVAERHPALRFIHLEADAGWLPYWLQRMEQHYALHGSSEHPEMKRSPTEYFRQNFLVACRGDETTLPNVVDLVGDDRLLFHTDYPHSDVRWPRILEDLEAQPIPAASRRRIFWDNAVPVFGLQAPRPASRDAVAMTS
jgi:predicted TIM-barrel fold metal-dependent hydrolase